LTANTPCPARSNPGTGKTTVAILYAKILKEMGWLSKGDVLIRTPADFIGSVVGESERRTADIIAAARGKVRACAAHVHSCRRSPHVP
jgi:hypothetical protein